MENSKLLEKLFEAISNSSRSRYVFVTDLEKNLSMWSKNCVEEFALPEDYVYNAGAEWEKRIHPVDRKRYHQSITEIFEGRTDTHYMTYRVMNKDGDYVVCTCSSSIIRDDDGKAIFFVGTIENHGIPSEFDNLTTLYTKEKLLDTMKDFKTEKQKYNILFVGIFNQNEINNVYGYDFGNKVIRAFADNLFNYIGDCEVYHAGGAKFAVLSTELGINRIKEIYDELVDFGRRKLSINGVKVTLNMGGAATEIKNLSVDEYAIFTNGIASLDESIDEKHGELIIFSNNYLSSTHKRIVVTNALRNSINEDCSGFYVSYQPVVNAQTESFVGAEALVRWEKDPFGSIPPADFINWLEDDPLFYELGMWIARTAITEFKEKVLTEYPKAVLSINISYTQLERSAFRKDLIDLLKKTGFPAENLCIELTERCRLLDRAFVMDEIKFLKSKGIRTLLDDFGTGYSALELMLFIPVSGIKIDKSFVVNIENDEKKRIVAQAIVGCAKQIGITTTIEGIETAGMASMLRHLGASYLQGYYYSKPLLIDELAEFAKAAETK